jgi:tryptophan 2,3-dioxygenase
MSNYTSPDQILARLERWEAQQRPILPMTDEEAREKLTKARLQEEEIGEKLERLTLNGERASARVLASYPDLQGLDRIDEANNGIDLSGNPKAANIRAVLQAAEIALLNISDLSKRIVQDIEVGQIGDAEEKYRWISSFQQTMHSLSLLGQKLPVSGKGTHTSIAHSPSAGTALGSLKDMHRALKNAGLVEPEHISTHDIHESGRNLTHQAFVDTTYTDIWMNSLGQVNIPNVSADAGEDAHAFYKRFVGTDALNLAVNELDQKGDNFLRQFRAYHQMSEILVGQANKLIAQSIKTILSPDGNLMEANDNIHTALNMLEIMNQNVVPILRNLSVNKYQDIRGSLGITSGSHSPHIKHGLFQPLYELLTEAVKFRVMNLQPYQEEGLRKQMEEIVENPSKDHTTHDQYTLLKQANELHLTLKTWRDLHIQFVKTQIGLAPEGETPTASISGSPSAMQAAHGMRHGAHGGRDVIVPVYETLLGRDFPAVSPFASVFRAGGEGNFAGGMLGKTAQVVTGRSESVQERVHER